MKKYTWYICANVHPNGMIKYHVILTDENGHVITYFVKKNLRESFTVIKQRSEEDCMGFSDNNMYVDISPDEKTLKMVYSTQFISNRMRILFKEDMFK